MTTERTQQQTRSEQQHARDLSLERTRPPAEVPGYEAERPLGSGAYGEVWVGVDRNTSRPVAIKFFMHRSGVDWTLLQSEVEKLVYLSADRYIVQLLEVGWNAEPPYYVMEFLENGSLADLLSERGVLPVGEATDLFEEIATGLLHAHGKGILHCDLKPANILLDQDNKPRLADFGQSRLSHEQSPALGTLFYMAPEQADLKAVPDARWDVYALGAIFYCLMTGEPPHRTPDNVREIEAADDLEDRLARYQTVIRQSPPATLHRTDARVDRGLADIIDRCIAQDPNRRFANVQSVMDAVRSREEARLRVPLMLLGFVGPMLVLVMMSMLALRGHEVAVGESELNTRRLARDRDEQTAKFAARSIEGEIARYFRRVREEAVEPGLAEAYFPCADSTVVAELNQPTNKAAQIEQLRDTFIKDEARVQLHAYLADRLAHYSQRLQIESDGLKLASMFAVDRHGRMLAVAFDDPQATTRSIGWNYGYRTYFHGGSEDLHDNFQVWHDGDWSKIEPIREPHFSSAFQSTSTGIWKIAVSTPIFRDGDSNGEPAGILALTVNLGDFAYFRSNLRPDRFAVLIDGRTGANRGVMLQHPLFDENAEAQKQTRFQVTDKQLTSIRTDPMYLYQDPLRAAAGGEKYDGDWIAAMEWVRWPRGSVETEEMIVLVQERYDKAIAPVKNLGGRLKREGAWALIGVIVVVGVSWYIVIRMLSEPRLRRQRPGNGGSPTPSVSHDLTTLQAPPRGK